MSAIAFNRSPLPNPQTIKGWIDRVQFKFLMGPISRFNNARRENARCKLPTSRARLQNSLVGIAGGQQRGNKLGNMSRSSGFHGDVNGGIAQIHPVISPVVGGFNNVGAMLGQNSGKPVQRAGIVRQMNSQPHQPAILHQTTLDDAGEKRDVDIATFLPSSGSL